MWRAARIALVCTLVGCADESLVGQGGASAASTTNASSVVSGTSTSASQTTVATTEAASSVSSSASSGGDTATGGGGYGGENGATVTASASQGATTDHTTNDAAEATATTNASNGAASSVASSSSGSGGGGTGGDASVSASTTGVGGNEGGAGGSNAACASDVPPQPNDAWELAGTFAITTETTGPGNHFVVNRPSTLGKGGFVHPVIVFSVGTGGSPKAYRDLLGTWASHGFVVIAGDSPEQGNGSQALEGLAWLAGEAKTQTSLYFGKIDPQRAGASGHSQGGNASIYVALGDARVQALAPLMPGGGLLGGVSPADESKLHTTTFYVCGENDALVPPAKCADRFATTPAPAWSGVILGASHNAPTSSPTGVNDPQVRKYTTAWFRAKLMHDCEAAKAFDGTPYGLASDAKWTSVTRK